MLESAGQPLLTGVGPLWKRHLRSEVQRRVRGCRWFVHPGWRCLPEWRPRPGGGRSTPPCTPRVPRGSRKGGPGWGISGLDAEVPQGPGNLDPRPLSALCEHMSLSPTPPLSGCRGRQGQGRVPTLCQPRCHGPTAQVPPPSWPRRPPGAAHHCSDHPPSRQSAVCPTEA